MSLSKPIVGGGIPCVRDLVWDGDAARRTSSQILVRFTIDHGNIHELGALWSELSAAYARASGDPPFRVVVDSWKRTELEFGDVTAEVDICHRPEARFKIIFGGTDYPVRIPALLAQTLRELGPVALVARRFLGGGDGKTAPVRFVHEFVTKPVTSVLLQERATLDLHSINKPV